MIIGVCGLGLIGGSLVKAFSARDNFTVYGYDASPLAQKLAVLTDSIDGELTEETLKQCDFIFVALYPYATVEYITKIAPFLAPDTIVIDCCGVKENICPPCFALAEKYHFHYIGGHPMAGTQFSGFKYAAESMFEDAGMILVPKPDEDIHLLDKVKSLLMQIGFTSVTITTAEKHDQMIAYTSQLAHVVSNAYVKSPNAQVHKGFSAGSYKDLTRVAKLNETMWTELFLANSTNLLAEIEGLIDNLDEYAEALRNNDAERLRILLKEGRECKERTDG